MGRRAAVFRRQRVDSSGVRFQWQAVAAAAAGVAAETPFQPPPTTAAA